MTLIKGLVASAALPPGGRSGLPATRGTKRSVLFQGKTEAQVRALSAQVGVDLERFCVLAQRIMWGLEQPDLIRVPVAETCERRRRELEPFFLSHLVVAYAERARGRRKEADEALAAARERLPADSPLAYVMPT